MAEKVELLIDSVGETLRPAINETVAEKFKEMAAKKAKAAPAPICATEESKTD